MSGPPIALIPLGDDGAACQDGFCELPAPVAPTKAPAQDDSAEAGQEDAGQGAASQDEASQDEASQDVSGR